MTREERRPADQRPTAGASAISRSGSNARESYKVLERLGFYLLLLLIAQATILLIYRLYDIAQGLSHSAEPGPDSSGMDRRPLLLGTTLTDPVTYVALAATFAPPELSTSYTTDSPLNATIPIAQIEARRDHPSGLELTGLPDARRSPARSLAPRRQDSGVIHGRHHLGPITRATIEWYLQRGEASRFHAHFRPENN
jgi:hypothetical protein